MYAHILHIHNIHTKHHIFKIWGQNCEHPELAEATTPKVRKSGFLAHYTAIERSFQHTRNKSMDSYFLQI